MEDKEKKQLDAVHERDLDNLLIKLGKKEDFDSGRIKCKFCKTILTRQNLYSLIAESGMVNFVCDKPACITSFLELTTNKNNI